MSEEEEIRYLGDVQKLSLEKGDVVVLSIPGTITQEVTDRLRNKLQDVLPGCRILILSEGMRLGVLHKVRR